MTIFVRQEDEKYEKFTETHLQRGYTLEQIKDMLSRSGLVFVEAVDMDTKSAPTKESERICIVARENGK